MSNLSDKEKKAAIDLLEARIERMTGKKVTYVTESKAEEIKSIHEQLEKMTGKKVVYQESKKAKFVEAVSKLIKESELSETEIEEGLGDIANKIGSGIQKGITKVGQVMGTKWDAPTAEKAYNDTYAKSAIATAQKLGIDAAAYKAAIVKYMMDRGGLAILGGNGKNAEWDATTRTFKSLASKTGGAGSVVMGEEKK